MNDRLLWLFLSGLVSAAISALWNYLSKRSLQRDEAETKVALAKLQNQFAQAERRAQAEAEQLERREQAAIDRSVFVTRAHFETEFEAMKQVFSHLSQLQIGLNGLRPILAVESPNESQEEKIARLFERLRNVFASYNNLLVESEARSPFYPAELYAAVEECERAASLEINAIRTSGENMFEPDWYEQGERNRGRFLKSYHKAAGIIRDRISRLAILPSTF
jgi:hypothetical protein